MRRIPIPFAISIALSGVLAIASVFNDRFDDIQQFGWLAADMLATVGLVVIARRAAPGPVATGALIAALAWGIRFTLELGALIVRPTTEVAWLGALASVGIASGFAAMIGSRSKSLAGLAVVAGVASPIAWLAFGITWRWWYITWGFADLIVIAVIAGVVSPEAASRPLPASGGRPFAIAAACLYALSLCLPAFVMSGISLSGHAHDQTIYGVMCVMYGWILWPGWLANPLLAIAAIAYALRRPRLTVVLTALALLSAVAAGVLLSYDRSLEVHHLHVAYPVWMAAIVSLGIAAVRSTRR